ncbi:hypothetical protein GCE86_05875 [Micromonospora terminaliae]|uniref:DUF4871 domain-containing protein n=1 Tax=Micromonospora terminaliae TaxID=1914461 RepID=A0AAJ2ZLF1_9ACTN|nr:hypothetical protein [Micromonospora terminaliae]NES31253.1 hypothetical protein [Micromonospora terminaliae]QGL46618.1 hypothetical protein GCE86_05875 [Micromonospora terminaliae]
MGSWGRPLLAAVVLLAGCTTAGRSATPATPAASAPTACAARVEEGRLPDWADAGFSGDARAPHVFGAKGEIVAVLFGQPLTVGRGEGPANKILWVARPAATPSPDPAAPATLVITATLAGTTTRATRKVAGGPGPSIVDLPQAGCWHLDLRWSGRTDTMDLVYLPA